MFDNRNLKYLHWSKGIKTLLIYITMVKDKKGSYILALVCDNGCNFSMIVGKKVNACVHVPSRKSTKISSIKNVII